jgi:uncharacterized circularly permuted ATP-grasp superfamily protein
VDAPAQYNALLEADPAAALEQAFWLNDAFSRRGITFDGAPMSSFLRPHFVERLEWDVLTSSGRRLLELAARVARRAFGGDVDRLLAWLGTPENEARWVRVDPGPPDVVLSRLDAFLTPTGPRFIEINSDAPAGFGYGDRMAEVFEELSAFRAFAARRPLRYEPSGERLVEAVLGAWHARGGDTMPRVAIVDYAEVKTRADQEILREAFAATGVPCVLEDPRALEVRDSKLCGASGVVDVVYRRGVLSELVEREAEVAALLRAYREGLCVFVNGFRCHLSEDKAFFGLLGDEAFASLLTVDEREFVRLTVPWTRKLEERKTMRDGNEVDLVPFVIRYREGLVLKPAHGYGGRSVFVGDETSAMDWERAVLDALGSAWVVQERVTIPEEPFPVVEAGRLSIELRKVNVNPFYVRGAEVGAVARASKSSVINVSAGGGSVPTFVVG